MVTISDLEVGKKDKRLECVITSGLDDAIREMAQELAGPGGNPRMFRSEAARKLLVVGVLARQNMKPKSAKK